VARCTQGAPVRPWCGAGQGRGGGSAQERWVDDGGGTRVMAVALVDNEPRTVAGGDGE
jgi:hypothetical protein